MRIAFINAYLLNGIVMDIKTNRLLLRPVVLGDFDQLYQMYSNPRVMQYIYDGHVFSEKESHDRVDGFVKHWQEHNFGMWVLEIRSSGDIAGYAGFRYFDDERSEFKGQVELGYIFDEPYWGCGYASEAICALVKVGFDEYNFKKILATILPGNIASQKVAEKAGLKHIFDADFNGLLHYVFGSEIHT